MSDNRADKSFWRGYLLGGATLVLVGLLWQFFSQPPPAYGQVPDSGAQRNQMIQELVSANTKLAEITKLVKEIRDLEKASASREATDARRP